MNQHYRLQVTKDEPIRFISHLDYMRTLERALRRAQLPLAYSEGFNPHIKMSFASALAVGITSSAEYLDLELKEPLTIEDVAQKISQALPLGIRLGQVQIRSGKSVKLAALINWAEYELLLPWSKDLAEQVLQEAVQKFNQAESVEHLKKTPKGQKIIDLKALLPEPIRLQFDESKLCVCLGIVQGNQGSVKPLEVLAAIKELAGLSLDLSQAQINRIGLFCRKDGNEFTPFEV